MPERRFGAVCASEEVVLLKYSFKNRLIKIWRRLFTSSFWQIVQQQVSDSFERALQYTIQCVRLQYNFKPKRDLPPLAPKKQPIQSQEKQLLDGVQLMHEAKSTMSLIQLPIKLRAKSKPKRIDLKDQSAS